MKKRVKAFLLILVITVMTIGMAVQVCAQDTGSITIQLENGAKGTSKEGVLFICDKVADLVDGEYQLVEEIRESRMDLNRIECALDAEIVANILYAYTTKKGVRVTTDETGKTMVDNLGVGMYLVYTDGKNDYEVIPPTLVSIPTWNEQQGGMDYDVTVIPKHSPNPYAPKTGDNSRLFFYCGGVLVTGTICVAIILKRKQKV